MYTARKRLYGVHVRFYLYVRVSCTLGRYGVLRLRLYRMLRRLPRKRLSIQGHNSQHKTRVLPCLLHNMHTGLPKDVRSWIFSVSTSPSGLLLIAGSGLVVARIRIFDVSPSIRRQQQQSNKKTPITCFDTSTLGIGQCYDHSFGGNCTM